MNAPAPAKLAELASVHERIAEDAGISVALVRCGGCASEQRVDGAKCLREGWPACCGYTMTLVTS